MGKRNKATDDQSFTAPSAPADTGALSAPTRLGPLDVQKKEFRVSRFGGYNMRDVDEFLDRITESMSAAAAENDRLRKGTPAASIVGTPDLDDVSRQADEIIQRARTEASRIVAEARTNASAPDDAASAATPEERAAVSAFLSREREFLQSLAGLVQGHAEQVKSMAKSAKPRQTVNAPADQPPGSSSPQKPAVEQDRYSTSPPAEASAPAAPATPSPPRDSGTPTPPPSTPERAAPTPPPSTPERTVRIDSPEPASVGRADAESDKPADADRSLRDLFWGED